MNSCETVENVGHIIELSQQPVLDTDQLCEVTDEDNEDVENNEPQPLDRHHTNNLLEATNKDIYSYHAKPITIDDWSEALLGWKQLEPYPKYVSVSRKRKPAGQSELNGVVKCVNDDDSDHHLKPWRASVEPLTFRYVANNANYRLNKFSLTGGDWYTIRKAIPEKVVSETELSHNTRESRSKKRGLRNKTELRSRSTNSDGVLTRGIATITNIQTHNKQHLSKSVTDLFMENLDSKLYQLEKRVKKNMQSNKVVGDDHSDCVRETNALCRKSKATNMTFNINNNIDSVDMYNDTCSITSSTASKNLRPLEKVTPKQRIKVGINKSLSKSQELSSLVDTTTYLNVGSSITFEGIDSEQLRTLDSPEKYDSLLLGKGKHTLSTKASSSSNQLIKNKGAAILKYTSASSYLKSKDKLWESSEQLDSEDMVTGIVGELPEVSGKQIPVIFTTHRLLRQ